MKKKLAFVLGGGGSHGALQAGALRALTEAGFRPDLVAGTSIGAANGAFLAAQGYSSEGCDRLIQIWETMVDRDLLPTDLWRQTMRAFFRRSKGSIQEQIREFAITNGMTPNLRFKDLQGVRLFTVATDLNAGRPVIFGLDLEEKVLEGVLASMTLPPWMLPFRQNGRTLMDGWVVSNLPIEVALQQGATSIIALDLIDHKWPSKNWPGPYPGFGDFLIKLDKTIENRETELELKLAQAKGVPVKTIKLSAEEAIPLWDFRHASQLIQRGYETAREMIDCWRLEERPR